MSSWMRWGVEAIPVIKLNLMYPHDRKVWYNDNRLSMITFLLKKGLQ